MDAAEWQRATEHASRERDGRLRRRLLAALFECRTSPSGWTGALKLRDMADSVAADDQRFQTEQHCVALLRDLAIKRLAEERRKSQKRGQVFGLRHLKYRIRAAGLDLHLEAVPPDPLIDDDRVDLASNGA